MLLGIQFLCGDLLRRHELIRHLLQFDLLGSFPALLLEDFGQHVVPYCSLGVLGLLCIAIVNLLGLIALQAGRLELQALVRLAARYSVGFKLHSFLLEIFHFLLRSLLDLHCRQGQERCYRLEGVLGLVVLVTLHLSILLRSVHLLVRTFLLFSASAVGLEAPVLATRPLLHTSRVSLSLAADAVDGGLGRSRYLLLGRSVLPEACGSITLRYQSLHQQVLVSRPLSVMVVELKLVIDIAVLAADLVVPGHLLPGLRVAVVEQLGSGRADVHGRTGHGHMRRVL